MRIDGLTPREHEIACLVAEGRTDRAIATKLHISSRTVEFHRRRIAEKWDLKGASDGMDTRVQITRRVLLMPAA